MKQVVILTGIDLCQARVNNHPNTGTIYLISKIFRIFANGITRTITATAAKVKALATFSNIMMVIAAIAVLVELPAAAVASETDSLESRITLAVAALVAAAALGLSMWKEGCFKPYNEEKDTF